MGRAASTLRIVNRARSDRALPRLVVCGFVVALGLPLEVRAQTSADAGTPGAEGTSDAAIEEPWPTTPESTVHDHLEVAPEDVAPEGEDASPDPQRFEVGGFPAIAYNSYYGVILGATVSVTKFDGAFTPYHYRIQQTVVASVRGSDTGVVSPLQSFETKLEFPGLLEGRLRLFTIARYQRIGLAGYFGIGNAVSPDIPLDYSGVRDRYFTYRRDSVEARAFGRYRLGHRTDFIFGSSMRGVFPTPSGDGALDRDILIAQSEDEPTLRGYRRHFVFDGLVGVLHDTRDDEFNPTRGGMHEASLRIGGGPSMDTRLRYGALYLNSRWFVPLYGEKLVFAARGIADIGFGHMPLVEMLSIGGYTNFMGPAGQEGNRGLPLGRQAGRVKFIANLELRSTFYRFHAGTHRFGLGAVAFVDGSRVLSALRPDPVRDGSGFGVLWSFGGGLRLVWNSAFVLRVDFAWSLNGGLDHGSSNALHVLVNHSF